MICTHHKCNPCPTCAGFDMYIPKSIANRDDVGYHVVTGNDNQHYEFNGATCFAELVEQRNMGFNQGSILKAVLRWDAKPDKEYNLKKIIYYAQRELLQVQESKGDRS